ncbi:MAG: hypothetical protein MRY83_08865 [Flavobacteriales bacterium]|nr:hypothetical protein [Flavobacteriales bacterium]
MRFFLLAVLIFGIQFSYGSGNIDSLVTTISNSRIDLGEIEKNISTVMPNATFDMEKENVIDFEHKRITLRIKDPRNAEYKLYLQGTSDRAYFILLKKKAYFKWKYPERIDEERKIILEKDLISFIKLFNAKYSTSYETEDLNEGSFKINQFGYACSVGGSMTESLRESIFLALQQKSDTLSNLLRSINPEDRIYGAIGLLCLKERGRHFTKVESRIINELQVSQYLINYCEGCSIRELKTVQELLNDKGWIEYYRHFFEQIDKQ